MVRVSRYFWCNTCQTSQLHEPEIDAHLRTVHNLREVTGRRRILTQQVASRFYLTISTWNFQGTKVTELFSASFDAKDLPDPSFSQGENQNETHDVERPA